MKLRLMLFALVTLTGMSMTGCTNAPTATRILEDQGYADIHMTGYRFFACSDDDWYHSGFEAVTSSGKHVTGVVCQGLLFKASTIRLD